MESKGVRSTKGRCKCREATYVNLVIEGTVLSDGDEDGLVVGSSVDGRGAVDTSGEATSDGRREDTVDGRIVQTPTKRCQLTPEPERPGDTNLKKANLL